jgi:hypothetical protein
MIQHADRVMPKTMVALMLERRCSNGQLIESHVGATGIAARL